MVLIVLLSDLAPGSGYPPENAAMLVRDGTDAALAHAPYPMKGVGPFTHTDPRDRPPEIFDTVNTLHFSPDAAPFLLLPVVPPK
jgi:hypothetical protein